MNHNGDMELAKKLINVAAESGADAVKFQTFKADQVVGSHAPKAQYQIRATGQMESQYEMIRRLELTESDHQELISHAKNQNINFLSTPFDTLSLRLLTSRFGLETIKISSGEITNAPFLLAVAQSAKDIILSTGMSTMEEIRAALGVLAFGFSAPPSSIPQQGDFDRSFVSEYGQQCLRERVTLLHCTSEYPAPFCDVNLRAMDSMATVFGLPVGYSDHTTGIHISLAAVARGARIIEKHITLDRNLPGPDHRASLEPDELRRLVLEIREIEQALGDGIKRPMPSEVENIPVARRSLVALRKINHGELFSVDNLGARRPGYGISPMQAWEWLGQPASKDFEADEILKE